MKTRIAKSVVLMCALVLGIASVQSASAQTFKLVKVKGGGLLAQVSSGGASVWALATNGHPYRFNGKQFVQANNIALSQISVGGGNATQADEVWALNSSGSIYRASKSGTTWSFTQVPGSLTVIAVGPGYQDNCHPYEVWGLNSGAAIFRYNYCGNTFDQVPGLLCEVTVGGGDIWGAVCGPDTYRFNFSTGVFDQTSPSPGFRAIPQLTVGSNGDVWAVDTGTGGVWYYSYVKWEDITFLPQVQAGNGVWALDGASHVYRWEPSVFDFKPVSSASLTSLSVGSGGGVWGLNSGKAYMFTTP